METRSRPALLLLALAIALCVSCGGEPRLPAGIYARIDTTKGVVYAFLDYEHAPLAVANFIGLAEGSLDATFGKPFYDGLSFHRVQEGLLIQGGDPAGDGSGGPGYIFPDEYHDRLKHDAPGVLGMAKYAPDTNGSQFYITIEAIPSLDGKYTSFGRVVEGMKAVKAMREGDVMKGVTILRIGEEAQAFKSDQAAWNAYLEQAAFALIQRKQAQKEVDITQILSLWPELRRRDDGFLVQVLKEGSGPTIRRFWLAKVSYKGMLSNGQVFDESSLHGGPIEFEVGSGQVIPGWDRMVMEMKKGEKRLVAIPPEYAYGSAGGASGIIPPDAFLIFELEISDYTE